MKNYVDTGIPTMSKIEMLKDYQRLKREYNLLHKEYMNTKRKLKQANKLIKSLEE